MEDNNTWIFPNNIEFETIPEYSKKFSVIPHDKTIIFDLRQTKTTHSSFIGFLIHAKQKIDKEGGILILKTSPSFDKILNMLNVSTYLNFTNQEMDEVDNPLYSPKLQKSNKQPIISH
ncbi:MAG: hypothetical protein SVZ03_10060 [Spirochaetota bacterium]|nr:hypothetical protein [Spirochaetota bacterium]